jgi:mannan endo-1,4-beta-mannosidase
MSLFDRRCCRPSLESSINGHHHSISDVRQGRRDDPAARRLRWMLTLAALAACQPAQVTPMNNADSSSPAARATSTGGTVSRPSYNTGNGFFVLNGKLYDANGNEFRMRGVNRTHYDSNSSAGIAKSGANAVRMGMYHESIGAATYINILKQHISTKVVPIVSMFYFPDNTSISCTNSTTEFTAGVAWWVANSAAFAPLSKYLIVNVANEWGPSNSTVWRDSYISAIASLRAAGYLNTILVDTGGCGQDVNDLLKYASAIFNSDPQKNVMFAFHFYGLGEGPPYSTVAQMNTIFSELAALGASQGMAFAITEFGPGRAIGPSPTNVTPGQVITAAEANNLGWLAWAWDDNNLAGTASNDSSFSMTYAGPGIYSTPADLTIYGKDVVLNPTYGITALAKPASIF